MIQSVSGAATLFEEHTALMTHGPFTQHQLRHSRLTHAAERGASTPMLMALSGHTSVRCLSKYTKVSAKPSVDGRRDRSRRTTAPMNAKGVVACHGEDFYSGWVCWNPMIMACSPVVNHWS
ncbi:tyrosine-type recombinase/integrase [Nocardia sp. NPDC051990]|uniref:tyrosine-type recombinase/integrase n=1 Tax=Nocardia sp. NPDC051990 TaxID=3155285 RepID=UPI00341FE1C8